MALSEREDEFEYEELRAPKLLVDMLDAVEEGEVDKEDFIPRKALSSSEGRLISIGGVCDFFEEAGLRVRVIFKP